MSLEDEQKALHGRIGTVSKKVFGLLQGTQRWVRRGLS